MNNYQEQTIKKLLKIRNIGPAVAKKLYNDGIYDFNSLRKLGTEDEYMMVDKSGEFYRTNHATYLHSIESEIVNCKLQDAPGKRNGELKDFNKSLRNHSKNF